MTVDLGAGEYIAFFSDRQLRQYWELFVMRPDGTAQERLTAEPLNLAGAYKLAWSPDGQRLVFDRGLGEGASSIEILDVATGELSTLLEDREGNNPQAPVWAPEGSRIAFNDANGDLFVMNDDGSGQRQLTTSLPQTLHTNPSWGPNDLIAFECECPPDSGIYVIPPDGGEMTLLVKGHMQQPAWSPDGELLAFVEDDHIHVVEADGSNQRRVTHANGHDPAWSPDGRELLFTRGDDIFVVGLDGAEERRLTHDPASDFSASWRPEID